ncbi:MAG: HipA N-terminal domain-containing protein [Myxococcota bacterium]
MRRAKVYNHGRLAGILEERDDGGYRFTYESSYLEDPETEPVSLTLPERSKPYESDQMFAFFYGLLSEGSTRRLQSALLKVDEDDAFGLLVATAADAIGSVTLGPYDDGE